MAINSNTAAAVVIPLAFPMVEPSLELPFLSQFLLILSKVFPLMIMPLLLAWAVRWLLPRLHGWILRHCRNMAFYLWAFNLTVVIGLRWYVSGTGPYVGRYSVMMLMAWFATLSVVLLWKKFPLIYGMCDETFSINYTAKIPDGIDKGWFMLWVTVLDYSYWVTGATMGAVFGDFLHFNSRGLDFVMTAMFVTIFMENWMKERDHRASILGILISVVSLQIFGPDSFVVPAMIMMLVCFMSLRSKLEIRKEAQA